MGFYENIWPDILRRWVGAPFATTQRLGVRETLAETEEWVVRRDGAGAVLKTRKHKSGTPEHLDFAMASRAIWEPEYRPHLDCRDEKRFGLPSLARRMVEHRETGRFLCFNMSRDASPAYSMPWGNRLVGNSILGAWRAGKTSGARR